MTKLIRRWKRDRSGATAVEFAIVSNLFLMMIIGVFSAGYFFLVKNDLENSISAAERYALVFEETDDQLRTVIRSGLSSYKASDVNLTFSRASAGGVDYVKVSVAYNLSLNSVFAIPPIAISTTRVFPT